MKSQYTLFKQFSGELDTRFDPVASNQLKKNYWMVLKSFVYYVGERGSLVTVRIPAYYLSDGATVPSYLGLNKHIRPWGRHGQACVLHDYLCEYLTIYIEEIPYRIDRKTADLIFLEAMQVLEVPVIKRYLMYWGVSAWRVYNGIKAPKPNIGKQQIEQRYRIFQGIPKHIPLPVLTPEQIKPIEPGSDADVLLRRILMTAIPDPTFIEDKP